MYGGQFPDDGSGQPDLKSHWQPFDMANLRFSANQDPKVKNEAMKKLNQRMVGPNLDPMTTPRTRELISGINGKDGWYGDGGKNLDQNSDFIPSQSPTSDIDLYRKIIQPGCQTCHAAQGSSSSSLNEKLTDTDPNTDTHKRKICGGSPVLEQNHVMANSLVPFERFWLDPALPPLLGCGRTPAGHPAL